MQNRMRQLAVYELLRKYSDDDEHFLSADEIIAFLKEEYGLSVNEKKTIYSDIKVLKKMGLAIFSHKKGFYMLETPFKVYEIKILKDLLANLKTISIKEKAELDRKLDSFLSKYDQAFLTFDQTKAAKTESYLFAKIIYALKRKEYLRYKEALIIPYRLILEKDYYYLYFVYPAKPKRFYALRLDHIKGLENTDQKHGLDLDQNALDAHIKKRVHSFMGEEIMVTIQINSDKAYIIESLEDTFKDLVIKKEEQTKVVLFTSLSDEFYASIARYNDKVKIIGPKIAISGYTAFLKAILANYFQPRCTP